MRLKKEKREREGGREEEERVWKGKKRVKDWIRRGRKREREREMVRGNITDVSIPEITGLMVSPYILVSSP